MCLGTSVSPQIVRKISEHSVDGGPGALVVVEPQVAEGVEGLAGAGVPQARVDGLDGLTVTDRQGRVVMAQLVEPDRLYTVLLEGAVPIGPERRSAKGRALAVAEHERVGGMCANVGAQGVDHDARKRDDPNAGLLLRGTEEQLASV